MVLSLPCVPWSKVQRFHRQAWLAVLGLLIGPVSAPCHVCLGQRGHLAKSGMLSPPVSSSTPNLL